MVRETLRTVWSARQTEFLAAAVALSLFVSSTLVAQVVPHTTEGNLASDSGAALKEVSDIKNTHNPVDIFPLVRTKIEQKRYEEAAEAYLIALAYGLYDSRRVQDKTAHQALLVLGNKAIGDLSREQIEKFEAAVQSLVKDKEKALASLARVGKPDYYPKYMVQHGLGVFLGDNGKDGLVPGFNPEKAWKDTLVEMFPR